MQRRKKSLQMKNTEKISNIKKMCSKKPSKNDVYSMIAKKTAEIK